MRRTPSKALAILSVVAGLGLGTARADTPRHVDATPNASFDEYVPGAALLEGQLLAPCCWDASRQTLDIHGSPIANELRTEIRRRLKAGETTDAIKADLVNRYTTKILAVPPDNPLKHMGTVLTVGLLGAGVLAARMVLRWRKKSPAVPLAPVPASASGAAHDEWDDRIDQELQDDD
jgi:cytochrome c-type biogenesis protein CcmH/NrfF